MKKRSMLPADDLQRRVMRCRRMETPASVLVVRIAGPVRTAPERILACFRMTDSVSIVRIRDGYELAGVFDEARFERDGVERRLRVALNGTDARIGWTRFPDDGVTLEVLLESARAALLTAAGSPPAPGRRPRHFALRAARLSSRSEVE
jgi:hypothetical protein